MDAHGVQRDTRDIDFLIASESVPAVEQVLFDLGYERLELSKLCARYRHLVKDAVPVDLLLVNTSTMDKLWSDRKPHELAGIHLFAPSVPGYVALKLHAIKWNSKRFGKDANDIVRLMEVNPAVLSMDDLHGLCERFGPAGVFEKFKVLLS